MLHREEAAVGWSWLEELECFEHGQSRGTLKRPMKAGINHGGVAARGKQVRLVSIEEKTA